MKACLRNVSLTAGIVLAGALGSARAADSDREFEIYGYAMADFIHDFKRLDSQWDDAFRPSKISVDGQFGTDGQSSLSVKQTRFGVKGAMPTGDGTAPIHFKFEFDFFGVGGDAGQTTIRLRHAYGEWGALLAGQTNSLFMDIDVFPNTIDYWGPTGMVFFRNVQMRWTPLRSDRGHFAMAIERPFNDIDPGNIRLVDQFSGAEIQNNEELPDLTAQWRINGDWGHVQVGAIVRKVGFEGRVTSAEPFRDGSETGWGINLGSAINTVGKDKVLLQVVYGEGIANYMNDGGMDLAPRVTGAPLAPRLEAEVVPLTGVLGYYDHWWNPKWSSSIGYSFTEVDNTNFQSPTAYNKGQYASVNLLTYPVDNLMIGAELLWGERENNDGASGEDTRFQFSIKYDFGVKL